MNRLINADAAEMELDRRIDQALWKDQYVHALSEAINVIKSQPSIDAVQVIRCEKCRFYKEYMDPHGVNMTLCTEGDGKYGRPCVVWTEPNGYCHKAKRKKEADT